MEVVKFHQSRFSQCMPCPALACMRNWWHQKVTRKYIYCQTFLLKSVVKNPWNEILHTYRSKTFDILRLISKFRSLQIGKWYSSLVINPAQLATVSDLGQTQLHKYLHTLHKYLHTYIHTKRSDEGRITGSTGVWDNDYWELGNYWIFWGDFLWDFYNQSFTSIPPKRSIWRKGFITNEFVGPA